MVDARGMKADKFGGNYLHINKESFMKYAMVGLYILIFIIMFMTFVLVLLAGNKPSKALLRPPLDTQCQFHTVTANNVATQSSSDSETPNN